MTANDFKIGQRVECILMKGKPWSILNKTGIVTAIDTSLNEIKVKFDCKIMGNTRPWIMYPNQLRRIND